MKKVLVLVGIAVLVWAIMQFPRVMINPGELLADHQDIRDKCTECHDPFWGISTEKCISCHKLDEIGLDDSGTNVSFHAKLENVECTSCHTEHIGLHPADVVGKFNHEMLGSEISGNCTSCHGTQNDSLHAHVSTNCGDCHTTTDWKSVSFNHNEITGGASQNCLACHTKPDDSYHQSLTGNCSECHSTSQWKPSTFDHSEYFVFDNHHNTQCSTCHPGNDYSTYTCYGCHEHNESNIRSEHQEEGIVNFSDCASCHHSGDEDEAGEHGHGEGSDHNNANDLQNFIDHQDNNGRDDDDDD